MDSKELIRELEELRDIENYSQSELMNTGYKTAILDAIDLVKKYDFLQLVSGLLPTTTEVSDKCEQDVKFFLETNSDEELKHYRVAHRRSFEFVIRHIDYNR